MRVLHPSAHSGLTALVYFYLSLLSFLNYFSPNWLKQVTSDPLQSGSAQDFFPQGSFSCTWSPCWFFLWLFQTALRRLLLWFSAGPIVSDWERKLVILVVLRTVFVHQIEASDRQSDFQGSLTGQQDANNLFSLLELLWINREHVRCPQWCVNYVKVKVFSIVLSFYSSSGETWTRVIRL